MTLVVQKFGGTSVGDPDRIRNVARRVVSTAEAGADVCVGPVATFAEAAADLGAAPPGHAAAAGAHTETWRRELGV